MKNSYKHSFARRLARWVMLVLLIMMAGLAFLIYQMTKSLMVESSADAFFNNIRASERTICDAMSDVSVAVSNSIFDVEENVSRPQQLQAIMERMVTANPRIRSCGISFIENYFPGKGRAYCPYAFRNDSLEVEGKPLEGSDASYLGSEWFSEAVAADSAYWSEPFFDSRDKTTPLVAYMCPVHDRQGRVVAILGADLSLDFMTQLLNEQDKAFLERAFFVPVSYDGMHSSYILSRDGTYLTHSDKRRILKGNFFSHIKDADEPGAAKDIIQKMSEGKKSSREIEHVVRVNRIRNCLFYAPLEGTNWIFAISVPMMSLNMMGILVGFIMLIIIVFVLLVTFYVCQLAIRRAAKPLKQLAAAADQVADGQFDTPLPAIRSHDEIHLLRDSFENMQHSLSTYVEELKDTTAAKASMESELKIAHDIQMSMLPKTYPAFPERHDIDIYGQVKPAKAVGGDLYDFLIRDEKLFFCIGDVSGKGVPASLVMAVTRSLFRNVADYTSEPDHIMMALNQAVSSNNETGMFVTLLLGVLDLSTGELSYTNAGHNPPLLLAGDDVSILSCDANVPAGVMPDWQFSVQHLQLKEGDMVFLYTDGLNEAEDASLSQFGMDRMLQVAKVTLKQPQPLIEAMTSSVGLFVGEAEQNDDMTMLAIQLTKP